MAINNNVRIKIQNIILPDEKICATEDLYFHRDIDAIMFDSYFGSLSIDKWKKYTNISKYYLQLCVRGVFELELIELTVNGELSGNMDNFPKTYETRVLLAKQISERDPNNCIIEIPESAGGMIAFKLIPKSSESKLCSGGYFGDIDESDLKEVNIAVNICTFRREEFITRNLKTLKEYIFEVDDNVLKEHLQIYISDNGKTLDIEELTNQYIHIVKNKNAGGAGGFTRGLLEIMKNMNSFKATHVLMMDDDVVVQPESLYRTYSVLRCRKEIYEDLHVGGAMLALHDSTLQVESGAYWNEGNLISLKQKLRVDGTYDCIINEVEENPDYNAWWYCCVPMNKVSENNLPLPIFFRGDDVEYGLRNMKDLFLLNGICVWHVAFDGKISSSARYYVLRNTLYDNAIHCKSYNGMKLARHLFMSVLRLVMRHQYKDAELIIRAVKDFYKGIDFLLKTDVEELNKKIMSSGYSFKSYEELGITKCGERTADGTETMSISVNSALYALTKKNIILCDEARENGFEVRRDIFHMMRLILKAIGLSIKSIFLYKKAARNFADNVFKVTNADFWRKYLEL